MLLFDDSISISDILSPNYTDSSNFRQIPDNQYVFLHNSSTQSVIIELLEYHHEDDLVYHFKELSGDNRVEIEVMQLSVNKSITRGQMAVAKFNKQEKDVVEVYLGMIRFPEYEADVLITVNCPANEPLSTDGIRILKELVDSFRVLKPSLFAGH